VRRPDRLTRSRQAPSYFEHNAGTTEKLSVDTIEFTDETGIFVQETPAEELDEELQDLYRQMLNRERK
jgi:hypothetical protein